MERLLTITDVADVLGVDKRTLYLWMEEGHFPRGIALSSKVVRWEIETVEKWIVAQKREAA